MVKIRHSLLLTLFLMATSFLTPATAKAETILEEIERTGVLRVGIRNDAIPFGYRKPNGQLTGYCVDFMAALKDQITERIDREWLLIRLFQSTASNRFGLVGDRTLHLECGPNTIPDELRETGVRFSKSFFVTGTQLLVLQSQRDRLNLESPLEGVRIAVIGGTTTEILLRERYPDAELVELQGSTARLRGAQGVLQGRFDGFVSDGILLVGQVEALQAIGIQTSNYAIVPNQPLSCDEYGMLIPDDPEWETLVNSFIDSEAEREIWRDWFEVALPKIETTQRVCNGN